MRLAEIDCCGCEAYVFGYELFCCKCLRGYIYEGDIITRYISPSYIAKTYCDKCRRITSHLDYRVSDPDLFICMGCNFHYFTYILSYDRSSLDQETARFIEYVFDRI